MTAARPDPASFRDPGGRVYERDGRIFRTVTEVAAADFEFVRSTGLLERLAHEGEVLPATPVDPGILGEPTPGVRYVVEHPRLPFVSYPYEWPFPALKAAALLHLRLHLRALDAGVTLSDASAYNVQFVGARPVFVDSLSFRRYRPGELWAGHRQFCEQFLNPLLLRALLGVPYNAWYRGTQEGIDTVSLSRLLPARRKLSWNVLSQVVLPAFFQRSAAADCGDQVARAVRTATFPLAAFRRMLRRLGAWIERIEPADRGPTTWGDYADTHSYAPDEVRKKREFLAAFTKARAPRLVWDLGCNTGDYAAVALEAGAGFVVGFDADQRALERAFARAQAERLAFLPLYLDAANPSPSQGWAQRERRGLGERVGADALFALAFAHHLAIGRNIPLDQLVDWLVGLAPAGVVEFVPKGDPMVQRLLRLREDIFPDYSEERFLHLIGARSRIVKVETISRSGRCLVWYERP